MQDILNNFSNKDPKSPIKIPLFKEITTLAGAFDLDVRNLKLRFLGFLRGKLSGKPEENIQNIQVVQDLIKLVETMSLYMPDDTDFSLFIYFSAEYKNQMYYVYSSKDHETFIMINKEGTDFEYISPIIES